MCGIVGYIGDKQALPILIEGLKKLEYRGYDSAGVAVHNGMCININKAKGRLNVLEERINRDELTGTLGIGHTRWLLMVNLPISIPIRIQINPETLRLCTTV